MSIIKSFSVGNGDMYYIVHGTDNFTVIDCNLKEDCKKIIMDEICRKGKNKGVMRFISTHPDDDHFHGIEYFDERFPIINFYCVDNEATKNDDNPSFEYYCKLRDKIDTFNLYRNCSRKWMNITDDERGGSGIDILWPILSNEYFVTELKIAKDGGNANNLSPIIKYSLNDGVSVLWFGDLETDFMELIEDEITLPKADIIFAPHHGRRSGKLPTKWLSQISPKIIVIGEADSTMLDYYRGYNTITQNSAKDITFKCESRKVHIYVSSTNYSVDFLSNENMADSELGNYIGTLKTY